MQKHRISELYLIQCTLKFDTYKATPAIVTLFKCKVAKAKMKLNHYKQLLCNLTAAEKLGKEPEHLSRKQEVKIGDKVKIKDGWQNSYLYVHWLAEYIGLEGNVRTVSSETGNYKVRTELDSHMPDRFLYNFPPEALEIVL